MGPRVDVDALEGLAVDADLRWTLLSALAKNGRADAARIDQELARDNTISGQEHAAAARALRPTAEAKAAVHQADRAMTEVRARQAADAAREAHETETQTARVIHWHTRDQHTHAEEEVATDGA